MSKIWMFSLFFFSLFLIFGCREKEPTETLPFIGKHDIALGDEPGYKAGDTIFHTIPDFSYLNQDSILISRADLKGKVWITKFFFAKCPTICPPMTGAMKSVHSKLAEFGDDILFLSFTIDPKNDTPAALRNYRDVHGITADNWIFLTGEQAATHQLGVEGFYVNAFEDEDAPGGFAHSQNFVLVDQNLHIRGVYDGLNEQQLEQLIVETQKLLKHASR
ncbi:MAG: SCO family protein [Crocinitomicaceae bacterium]|nr:SCO family protein [Crocinitomicaceae bacterium]